MLKVKSITQQDQKIHIRMKDKNKIKKIKKTINKVLEEFLIMTKKKNKVLTHFLFHFKTQKIAFLLKLQSHKDLKP